MLGSHQQRCTQDRRPRSVVFAKAVRNQTVPPRAECRGETDNRAITAIVQARCPLFGHIARMPDETDAKKIITASFLRTGGGHEDVLVLNGWRLSRKTWNLTLSLDEAVNASTLEASRGVQVVRVQTGGAPLTRTYQGWESSGRKQRWQLKSSKQIRMASNCGPVHPLGRGLNQGQGEVFIKSAINYIWYFVSHNLVASAEN